MSLARAILAILGFSLVVIGVALLSTPGALIVAGTGLLADIYTRRAG